jgi:DNA-directed RNA polymerase specialized sigma24 family protein
MDLESDTEDQAWEALMQAAAHMPYPDKAAFIQRGYHVDKLEEVPDE